MSERKPVTIRFRFNQATGQIEEFLIDDHDRTASETYHDRIARAIAGQLFRNPQVVDAGAADADANATPSLTTPQSTPTSPQHEASGQ